MELCSRLDNNYGWLASFYSSFLDVLGSQTWHTSTGTECFQEKLCAEMSDQGWMTLTVIKDVSFGGLTCIILCDIYVDIFYAERTAKYYWCIHAAVISRFCSVLDLIFRDVILFKWLDGYFKHGMQNKINMLRPRQHLPAVNA